MFAIRENYGLVCAVFELRHDMADYFVRFFLAESRGASAQITSLLASYLPGLIRTMRFGASQAHGRAALLQFNYLLTCGAIRSEGDALPAIDPTLLEEGLVSLAREILTIQLNGDVDAAQRMADTYCSCSPENAALLTRLAHLPVDVTISFTGV